MLGRQWSAALKGARLLLRPPCLTSCALSSSTVSPLHTVKKPAISQKVRFIDQLRIVARGGTGGGGSSALFGRTGHHPRAAGGNGAPGGAVVLRATRQLTGLGSIPLHVEGDRGGHGGKQWMEGKKGADKVVPVPLGTMVWRLVQLRGSEGAGTPHGIIPLTPTAPAARTSAVQHSPMQPASQQQQQPLTEPQLGKAQDSRHDVRRKLFDLSQQLPGQNTPDAAEQAGEGSVGVHLAHASSRFSAESSADSPQHVTAASGIDSGDESADAQLHVLYDDLLQSRRVLSNQEKLHLLHYGSLGGGAVDSAGWEVQADQQEVRGSDSASGSDIDFEEFEGEAGTWEQDSSSSEWRGLGEHGVVEQRHFSKQQVWSILSAQAELLGVLEAEGQQLVVATGGRGGKGNAVAPSDHHRPASKVRSDGQPGQEVLLQLQLRLMADVALLGLPNVGTSSLIAALTGARAQVGSYAFTTIRPQLGTLLPVVPYTEPAAAQQQPEGGTHALVQPDVSVAGQSDPDAGRGTALDALAAAAAAGKEAARGLTGHKLLLADLPGLVPGAHEGRGRGISFLQHSLKARCIALVIDLTGSPSVGEVDGPCQGDAGRLVEAAGAAARQLGSEHWEVQVPYSPQQQLEILLDELRRFDAATLCRPMLIVANKVDALSTAEAAEALHRLKAVTDLPIIPISARQHLGLVRLKQSLEVLAGGDVTGSG